MPGAGEVSFGASNAGPSTVREGPQLDQIREARRRFRQRRPRADARPSLQLRRNVDARNKAMYAGHGAPVPAVTGSRHTQAVDVFAIIGVGTNTGHSSSVCSIPLAADLRYRRRWRWGWGHDWRGRRRRWRKCAEKVCHARDKIIRVAVAAKRPAWKCRAGKGEWACRIRDRLHATISIVEV